MTFSDLLIQARQAKGLSIAETARRAGTSRAAITAYETGRRAPSADTLERVLAALDHELTATPVTHHPNPHNQEEQ